MSLRACRLPAAWKGPRFASLLGAFATVALLACPPAVYGDTIILEGRLESELRISKEMRWTVDRPLSELTVELAVPQSFSNRVLSQQVHNLHIDVTPEPASVVEDRDSLGNLRRKVTWRNLRTDPQVKITFDARVEAGLSKMESTSPFPLKDIGVPERRYLKATPLVQVENPEIQALARRLMAGATTELQAVTAVINYIADNIRYVYNPVRYDALSTLRDGSGNCTNSAHLSAALLRASGIPARIVGGTTLDKRLKVPMDGVRSLVQTMGKGGHAWIEVYFPDLGWLSYDPKQSKQFTSTRHVKESHGTDTSDIAESWIGSPYAPAYSSVIDARFLQDSVKVRSVLMQDTPKSHVMSNDFKADIGVIVGGATVVAEGQASGGGTAGPSAAPSLTGARQAPPTVEAPVSPPLRPGEADVAEAQPPQIPPPTVQTPVPTVETRGRR